MPRLSLGLGVQTIRKVGGGGAPPSGIAYADAPATAISVINFTLFKENTFGDGNLLYQFDEGINTPTNYYAYSEWNYESGIGKRAILAFNVNASTYYSNQSGQGIGDVTLSPNKWYLILFTAGIDVEGSIPPVPSAVFSTAYLILIPNFSPLPKYGSKSSALYEVAKTISVIPAWAAFLIWCSVNGTPATCNIGFGVLDVSGINLVPMPPTNKIAEVFMGRSALPLFLYFHQLQ